MPAHTLCAILRRHQMPCLHDCDPLTGEVIRASNYGRQLGKPAAQKKARIGFRLRAPGRRPSFPAGVPRDASRREVRDLLSVPGPGRRLFPRHHHYRTGYHRHHFSDRRLNDIAVLDAKHVHQASLPVADCRRTTTTPPFSASPPLTECAEVGDEYALRSNIREAHPVLVLIAIRCRRILFGCRGDVAAKRRPRRCSPSYLCPLVRSCPTS